MYKPRYIVTSKITSYLEQIGVLLGELKTLEIPKEYRLEYAKKVNAEIVHSSTAIEGNTLTQSQVEEILEGKEIKAVKNEILEIQNYNSALIYVESISNKLDIITEHTIRHLHSLVLKEIDDPNAGKYRDIQVHVGKYIPPESFDVPILMNDFVEWLNSPTIEDISKFIYAGIAHYRFVEIHPFIDGNGRTTRILTNFLLARNGYNIAKYFSLETFYNKNRTAYYQALDSADQRRVDGNAELTLWLEYFLFGMITQAETAKSRILELSNKPITQEIPIRLNNNQKKALKYIKNNKTVTRQQYISISNLSPAGATNDLNILLKSGLINRHGSIKSTYYSLTSKGNEYL